MISLIEYPDPPDPNGGGSIVVILIGFLMIVLGTLWYFIIR